MRSSTLFTALVACTSSVFAADKVYGAAEGFAKGVTGGGSAAPVYPTTNAELVSYLGDSSARVIVLTKTFDFTGTEGKTTSAGCSPWGTAAGCQIAINKDNCDNAGVLGITVKSNKSLIGQGAKGVIKGKGIRMVSGAKNIIIQNIMITELNPRYVWGGDAITVNNADLIWIDRVTTSLIGRQHYVLGTDASNRITLSNNYINGVSSWSATCDGYHYWAIYLTGSNDLVTMKGNYIYHTSGRGPKVSGNTLLHAVNNYWYDSTGHLFEATTGAYILAEGNVFQNIKTVVETPVTGQILSVPNAVCNTYLGRACQNNGFGSSGTFSYANTGFMSKFSGKNIASAAAYTGVAASVKATAGYGHI
ncbi:putative pectin lyase A [Glarea lozoyensis 74030]|uniref:pectin lyase n=1 Tax=Glarea lozoyensis (strain ATCC 74030 / MF5533) TaxID=1104152 RepID=H0EGQ2_GLAL7|nr:putative pectin lyase A [Glarea lozoyensis 74030]